jgi:hypothetical protein
MVVVPLQKSSKDSAPEAPAAETNSRSWAGVAAGGSLLVGGLLLLSGKRRAALVAAAAGTTLALLDQKDALSSWWNLLPVYIEQVQRVLNQVQAGVEDVAVKREKLRKILAR